MTEQRVSTENRLVKDAKTILDAEWYIRGRVRQGLHAGWRFASEIFNEEDKAVVAYLTHPQFGLHKVIYVLDQYKGIGLYQKLNKIYDAPILTMWDCELEVYLKEKSIPYRMADFQTTLQRPAYMMASHFYDNEKTKRSAIPLMNHIDEGLFVLSELGADRITMDAWIVHPLFQTDSALKNTLHYCRNYFYGLEEHCILYAMEYRNVANQYLSERTISSIEDIALSPLEQVNQMLIADKVQNRNDFIRYHKGTHPKSDCLEKYFENWLLRLGVTREQADSWCKVIDSVNK